ncbi:MAG: nicotinate-nucleotide--dimethylbenzimidazole phosphoribosyltransferase [Campylobacterota bacterium]|nr:nicotinate-nucleotide--dimethylbenzimidazole phosphoribosyltransferase [Campylobacterota bacterium]
MLIRRIKDNTQITDFATEADFLLAASVTYTCNIPKITQAGIEGMIPLTPTLDAELITKGTVCSLPQLASTPKGVPTPALLTRTAQVLKPFSSMKILDLGLQSRPKNCEVIDFEISPSNSIASHAQINSRCIFFKGVDAAKNYTPKSGTLILGESTPSGTTTANATIKALGFNSDGMFASSFKDAPTSVKEKHIAQALSHIDNSMSSFEKLSAVADNMLIFCAGFILEATQHYRVILAGGTQMAAVLLTAQKLALELKIGFKSANISLCTTAWVVEDENSNILGLLNQLSTPVESYYADFHFTHANISVLKSYDDGEAKEGVGAGAAIAYLFANGFSEQEITNSVETIMGSMLS